MSDLKQRLLDILREEIVRADDDERQAAVERIEALLGELLGER